MIALIFLLPYVTSAYKLLSSHTRQKIISWYRHCYLSNNNYILIYLQG